MAGEGTLWRGSVTHAGSERAGTTSKFYLGDQPGSTRGITNSTQTITGSREKDAFGSTVSSSGSTATPFFWAGGYGYKAVRRTG